MMFLLGRTLVHEPLPCSSQETWGIAKHPLNWANEITSTFHLDSSPQHYRAVSTAVYRDRPE
jgi:hypothetical protein